MTSSHLSLNLIAFSYSSKSIFRIILSSTFSTPFIKNFEFLGSNNSFSSGNILKAATIPPLEPFGALISHLTSSSKGVTTEVLTKARSSKIFPINEFQSRVPLKFLSMIFMKGAESVTLYKVKSAGNSILDNAESISEIVEVETGPKSTLNPLK